jgi:hypothetical protein
MVGEPFNNINFLNIKFMIDLNKFKSYSLPPKYLTIETWTNALSKYLIAGPE